MWETVTPGSWAELVEALYADSWDAGLRRHRSPYAFRGMVDDWRLETSLSRLAGPTEVLERHLLRNFRKYAHGDVVESDSVWHWLTLAQHHGLPTRLLDWTYSPFVALHFATDDLEAMDTDGVIWMVDIARTHERLPEVLRRALADEGSLVFTVEMLARLGGGGLARQGGSEAVGGLAELDALGRDAPFLLFLEPPSIDQRLVNQFALSSLLPDPGLRLDDWLAGNRELCRRVAVPAALKWEARDKLDQANVTERVLFPGLDGLGRWLRRHYSRRDAPPDRRRCRGTEE